MLLGGEGLTQISPYREQDQSANSFAISTEVDLKTFPIYWSCDYM